MRFYPFSMGFDKKLRNFVKIPKITYLISSPSVSGMTGCASLLIATLLMFSFYGNGKIFLVKSVQNKVAAKILPIFEFRAVPGSPRPLSMYQPLLELTIVRLTIN